MFIYKYFIYYICDFDFLVFNLIVVFLKSQLLFNVYKEIYYNYMMLFGNNFNEFDFGFCILKLIGVFIKL